MTSLPLLPGELEIRHKFVTVSVQLMFRSGSGEKLFRVYCPSLRLQRCAYLYAVREKEELLLWMSPVWGLTWNVQINLPNDEILGVLRKERSETTGRVEWVAIDANGEKMLTVRPEGTVLHRLRKRLTLFSKQEEKIFVGDKSVGSFIRRAGYVHERYSVKLDPETRQFVEPRFLLAAATGLTGIFDRLFT
jgi:hypothetical protein